jgi:PleD family two-component response regulator
VLIVDDQEWSTRALESVLTPAGYEVGRAYTHARGLDRARAEPPDLMFINLNLPDGTGVSLCRALREDPHFTANIPIIVTSPGRPTREQRLAVLEAGAWDVLTYPLDAQELIPKLAAYTEATFELDRVRWESLIDQQTGLYNLHGLEQRAQELRSLSQRQRRGLACVVLAPLSPSEEDRKAVVAAALHLASTLRTAGRASDAIGRLGSTEFAIFAPSTDAQGAARLAERLAVAVRSAREDDNVPFGLRAGYDAVENVFETPAKAEDLLPRATIALRRAMVTGEADWIQPFESRSAQS